MSYNIEFKQNDSDMVGAILSDMHGNIDLTDKTVIFVLRGGNIRYEIPCILGGIYNKLYYSAANGGITIPFFPTDTFNPTENAGIFKGEFIISWTSNGYTYTKRSPSGNNTISIMIYESL